MYHQRGLYEKMTREEARQQGATHLIRVKWVDHDKGEPGKPKIRSRLVALEFAHGAKCDDIFAPTPSLEAFKILLSKLASIFRNGPGSHRLMLIDVSRVFFYAPAQRELWVELPDEDKTE